MTDDIFGGVGIRVKFKNTDDFLIICETLTRIGIPGKKDFENNQEEKSKRKLFQSCHLLHKKGQYAILHFKEFFKLDGRTSNISENDLARRNTIVNMLERWGLLIIIDKEKSSSLVLPDSHIKVIKSKEKSEWDLVAKYRVGNKNSGNR